MDDLEKHSPGPLSLSKEDLETLFEKTFEEQGAKEAQKTPQIPPFLGAKTHLKKTSQEKVEPDSKDRAKSSLRMKYEAEVQHICKTHGNLEDIRRSLGLSKRKISQLLLVDPSAWTRWSSKKGEAPPHIYRALQWYLLLQEKHPEYRSSLWLNAVATPQISQKELESIKKEVLLEAQRQRESGEQPVESLKDSFATQLKEAQKERDDLKAKIKKLGWLYVFLLALCLFALILKII